VILTYAVLHDCLALLTTGNGFLRVSLQLHKWGRSSAAGARIEAPKAPTGLGVGQRGGGCAPSLHLEKILILALNMVSFRAFWMVFLQFSYLFYTQNRCSLVPIPIFF